MRVAEDDLLPWNDPEDILRAVVSIPRDQLPELKDSLRRLLRHEDADVREHAARRLLVHLRDRESHGEAVRLLGDPAEGVRRAAAYALTATSSSATREADARELLRVFWNQEQPLIVRGAAYEALLLLYGRKDFPPGNREIDLSHDVDWEWLRALSKEESL